MRYSLWEGYVGMKAHIMYMDTLPFHPSLLHLPLISVPSLDCSVMVTSSRKPSLTTYRIGKFLLLLAFKGWCSLLSPFGNYALQQVRLGFTSVAPLLDWRLAAVLGISRAYVWRLGKHCNRWLNK